MNKKVRVRSDPTVAVYGWSASLNDAVGMGMEGAPGTPSVKDASTADACPEMVGICGQGKEGIVRGLEQSSVAPSPIGSDKGMQIMGKSKDDMEVGHRKELL